MVTVNEYVRLLLTVTGSGESVRLTDKSACGVGVSSVTVTLTVPEIVWLVGEVASVTVTVKVCTPADKPDTVAVLSFWAIVPGPAKT